MIRKVEYNGNTIEYNFEFKKVKNINLRIKSDLTVNVSANKRVKLSFIDDFVKSKGDFILSSISSLSNRKIIINVPKFTESEFVSYINNTFNSVSELFNSQVKLTPSLKMRKMTSSWGTCNYVKGIITLNKNLIYCTKEQIYYVIVHEFAHLIVHNHSKEFYNIVEKYCKNYKEIRNEMKNIVL